MAPDGWADGVARRYPSHAALVPPFRDRAADLRPTAHGWVDIAPDRGTGGLSVSNADESGPGEGVLSGLLGRVRRYFTAHSTPGVIGDAETGLARICLMLARFEAGVLPEPGVTVEQIHRSVPEDEVRELVGLVKTLHGALPGRAGIPPGVAEPVFVRGWAEGDLMVGGTLIAVSLGDRAEVARRLRHLVAHAWLDVDELYRIRQLGVYLAVSGTLVTWPVADLAARLLSGADPDAARAEFRALAEREITVPRPVASPETTVRRRDPAQAQASRPAKKLNRATPEWTVYGPEEWDTVAGVEWSYWDLWFSVVCVVDCGGDWDALDVKVNSRSYLGESDERMWSHLVDLRDRLTAAGITGGDLVGDLAGHRKTLTKARSKVLERTGVRDKDYSPAMRDVPSGRYAVRAHFGSWDLYPVSPRSFYQRLAGATPFDLEAPGWGLPTFENVDPLFEELEELEAEHADDPPTLLAVRRAGLTACSLAQHRCNDSYGDLGEHTLAVVQRFSRTDWRVTGIDPAVFWRDVLEVFAMLGNFGATYEHESELMTNLDAERDRDLLERIVDDLRASYAAERLDWQAREVKSLLESV
ncbi:hypothetical protein [Actinomadura macra]|uniref:hypothetical protein n=1 Tax=Actinomadura macra TaxID=46164 RepID=UPI0012F81763|nr:hypothetical protein [Actinomadura macra]